MSNKNIDIEELASLPIFYSTTVSWSKTKVAFFWNKTTRHELYVKDIPTGEVKQVSKGQLPRSPKAPISWSRDDKYIVTGIDVAGNEQYDLYAFDIETGEFFEVTKSEGQNYPGDFSPDNKKMIVYSSREKQMNLYILNWQTKEIKKLTDFDNPVLRGIWAEDGEWIYFHTNECKDLRNIDIYRIRPDGTGLMRFLSLKEGSQDYITDISFTNNLAAITSDFKGLYQPGIVNLKTKEIRWFGDSKHEETSLELSKDGRYLLTIKSINAEWRPVLYEVDTGKKLDLNLPKGVYLSCQFVSKDKIFLTHSAPTHRERMLLYDMVKGTYQVFQEAEYGSIDPKVFSDAECIKYKSKDGTEIEAILYKPRDIKSNEKVPAVVFVHGGPEAQDILRFDIYAQFITSLGFAVLQPNFRGSIGYGKVFREALINDWGGKDAEDIVAGAEYLKKLPWIDGNRIVVAGGSYGGYATYWQMVKYPKTWAAGIAWMGITDLLRLYEESMPHLRYFLREAMGEPEKNKDLWIERSPITHAKNLKAPLLIIHGVNDPRCPISQARIFRDKLIKLGFKKGEDFEYTELSEEGHGSTDRDQRIRIFKLIAKFLTRRLQCKN
jgi:dipeptidyl aminopeptidase/acylaminoacyl peptidase